MNQRMKSFDNLHKTNENGASASANTVLQCLVQSRSASVSSLAQHPSCICISFLWWQVKRSLSHTYMWLQKEREIAHPCLKVHGMVAVSNDWLLKVDFHSSSQDNSIILSCLPTVKSLGISEVSMLNGSLVQLFTSAVSDKIFTELLSEREESFTLLSRFKLCQTESAPKQGYPKHHLPCLWFRTTQSFSALCWFCPAHQKHW